MFPQIILEVKIIIKEVIIENTELIDRDCHEVAISGKIMCRLSDRFKDWDVDIEYNRDVDAVKKRDNQDSLRPDIIIHRRGLTGHINNYIIIEIKKQASAKDQDEDIGVLKEMTLLNGRYQYAHGLFVNIIDSQNIHFKYVHNGVV